MQQPERFTIMMKRIVEASNHDKLLGEVNAWLEQNGYKPISGSALKRYPNAGMPYEKSGPPKQLWLWIATKHLSMFGRLI